MAGRREAFDRILVHYAPGDTASSLAAKAGVSYSTVCNYKPKLEILGLHLRRKRNPTSEENARLILKLHDQGFANHEIEAYVTCSRQWISKVIKEREKYHG